MKSTVKQRALAKTVEVAAREDKGGPDEIRHTKRDKRMLDLAEKLSEMVRLREQAIGERNVARAEIIMLNAALYKSEKRLDACLYSMVLLQGMIKKGVAKEQQEQIQNLMRSDSVSLAG